MADDQAAFMAAIRAAPSDDLPRLVYADWLEERGDPERAEFIRLQCRLAAMAVYHPGRAEALRREAELLAAHRERWATPLGLGPRPPCAWFERGFPVFLEAHVAADYAERWADLAALTPTPWLALGWTFPGEIADLSACPGLALLTGLWTNDDGSRFPPDEFAGLVGSPFAQNLEWLNLGGSQWVGEAESGAVELLAATPALPKLAHLRPVAGFRNPRWLAAVLALLTSRHRAALRGLEVWYFGDAEAEALAACPGLARLKAFHFGSHGITDDGARFLLDSPYLDGAEVLDLSLGDWEFSEATRDQLYGRFGTRVILDRDRGDPRMFRYDPISDRRRRG